MSAITAAEAQPLVVRTVPIADPGDLVSVLPEAGMCWVRRDEGMVAWGEVARIDTSGENRIVDARAWWDEISSHAVVRDNVQVRGSGLVAFGSFSFSEASAHGGTLIIPRYVLGTRDGVSWLTQIDADSRIGTPTLSAALVDDTTPLPLGKVTIESGDEQSWRDAVRDAVAAISRGTLDKVVLARDVYATSSTPIDVRTLLSPLAHEYPTCWTFHVDGMVGATPELLARVDRGLVTSRVLAGTIRPSGNDIADLAHAADLARSSKDREEHEYAAKSVTDALLLHCSSVNVPEEPSVLHLPNVMHLATDVTGVLRDDASSLDVVAALHPSAAVCGTPTQAAALMIGELEGMDRGRYAGPVGWIDQSGDGEWCIALRSAELDANDPTKLRLFAGCGIVAASQPAAEWAESEAKLEAMKGVLGV